MKKSFIMFLLVLNIACGSIPKSSAPNQCQDEQKTINELNQKVDLCKTESNTYRKLLDYTVIILGVIVGTKVTDYIIDKNKD